MESPLSKVSRDMERLNQSLARMKAVDSAETTQADVTTSESLSQSSVIPDSINHIFSSVASPSSPVHQHPVKLSFDDYDTRIIPQSVEDVPSLPLLSSLNASTSPTSQSAGEELMRARALAESAYTRVSAAEALCSELGRRISLVEHQARMGSSPVILESETRLRQLHESNETADHSSPGREMDMKSSRTNSSRLVYASARPDSLNGSVKSPLQSKRSTRSSSNSRATKATILAQARSHESVLYGKSWGKPLETSRAEIDSPPPFDSSSDEDEDEEADEILVDVLDEHESKNVVEKSNYTKLFPMNSILSQSMMVMKQQDESSRRIQTATQSPRKKIVPEQYLFRSQDLVLSLPVDESLGVPSSKTVQVIPYTASNQDEALMSNQQIPLTTTASESELKSLLPSVMTRTGGADSSLKDKFEARLTKLEAVLNSRHMTEIKENEKTSSIDNSEQASIERKEKEASHAAAALKLHADMSTAAALEMALLREKLREMSEALLFLRQEVASLPSRGGSPVIDDNESMEENAYGVDVPCPPNRRDPRIQSSPSTALTAASALIRCAELEGRLTAAKLEGQVKEHRWISSVQAVQLGVVVKAVQDCVVALAPRSVDRYQVRQQISHEKPQGAVGSKREGSVMDAYLQRSGALRQAYWPNERSLFQRPCWGKESIANGDISKRQTSAHFSHREAKETAEKELNDIVDRLRSTLSTCAAVIDVDNVAARYHSSTRGES